uniref:Uncharacterized protein n=1 Tax=Brassica oleracea TaxID=3712 RepID=A0A3P6DN41_BRAOL|nr:unnamed protein product [Brassica oleracea]
MNKGFSFTLFFLLDSPVTLYLTFIISFFFFFLEQEILLMIVFQSSSKCIYLMIPEMIWTYPFLSTASYQSHYLST